MEGKKADKVAEYTKNSQLFNNGKNKGRLAEKHTVNKFNKKLKKFGITAKKTVASGAIFDDADIKIDGFMIEEKSGGFSLKKTYEKLKEQAKKKFPTPEIALKFRIEDKEVVLLDWDSFVSLYAFMKKERHDA